MGRTVERYASYGIGVCRYADSAGDAASAPARRALDSGTLHFDLQKRLSFGDFPNHPKNGKSR